MNRRELIRLGATSALLVPGTGCATLWQLFNKLIDAPKLSIRKMDITKMSLSTMSVKFLGDITNPNPIGFKLFGLDYLLRVAGSQLAKGSAPQGIELKANGKAETELEMDFALGKTASAILDLIEKRVVPYELEAVGKFLSKKGGVNVPVGFSGKLPMPLLPSFTVRSFEPTNVSSSGVGFRIQTEVKNNNDFEIPVDGFSFDVKVDGRSVLQNKGAKGLRIAPSKKSVVPLDFKVGLGDLGVSIAEAMSGKRMKWELLTELKSGRLVVPFDNKGTFRLS